MTAIGPAVLGVSIAAWAVAATEGAAARSVPIPAAAAAVVTVDIPDDWPAKATGDGVSSSTDNGTVRLVVQFIPAPDRESASAAAMASLERSGVSPVPESRRASEQRYGGLDAWKVDFSGADRNGESEITVILIALPAKAGFVAIEYWGDDEAQESVGNDLQGIAESVRLAK